MLIVHSNIIHYPGPPVNEDRKSREKVPLSRNVSASLDNQNQRSATPSPLRRPKSQLEIRVTEKERSELSEDEAATIRAYEDSIGIAANNRLIAFFQQLVLTYSTGLHFEVGKTLAQAESARQVRLSSPSGKTHRLKMDASHHSTIPCLLAYNVVDWNCYKKDPGKNPKPKAVIYLKGSDAYKFWNATIELPKAVNLNVDNIIDLKEGGLREKGVALLNRSSAGTLEPEEGLFQFIRLFKTVIRDRLSAAQAKDKAKIAGLQIYQRKLSGFEEQLREDRSLFAKYLDIRVQAGDLGSQAAKKIYQIRYKAIQSNSSHQSDLTTRIDRLKEQILPKLGRVAYKEEAFQAALLKHTSAKNRSHLKKLLASPETTPQTKVAAIIEKIEKVNITIQVGGRKVNKTGLKLIQDFAADFDQTLKTMRVEEEHVRHNTMLTLRKMRNLTQKELSNKIKTTFPGLPASTATLSRCETGRRHIDTGFAEKLSIVLNVDPALFTPQFFYS